MAKKIEEQTIEVKVNKIAGGIMCLHEELATGEIEGEKFRLIKASASLIFRYKGDDIEMPLRNFVDGILDLLNAEGK